MSSAGVQYFAPEACGGLALGLDAMALICTELGRVAAPEPILEVGGVAVSLLAEIKPNAARDALLENIIRAPTVVILCAHACDADAQLPTARMSGDTVQINGLVDHVPLARSANDFLVPVSEDDEISIYRVPASAPQLVVSSRALADNTTHATLEFNALELRATNRLARGANSRPGDAACHRLWTIIKRRLLVRPG